MTLSLRAQSYLSLVALGLGAAAAVHLSSSCASPRFAATGSAREATQLTSPQGVAPAAAAPGSAGPSEPGLAAAGAPGASASSSSASAAPQADQPPPSAHPLTRYQVAAIGDSITDERSYPHAYMRQLRDACPKSRWDNYGVGGNMVNQMRRRFDAAVLGPGKPKYTHLIVMGGVNDVYSDQTAGRTPGKIQHDLSYIYQRAKAAHISVIGVTITPWAGFKRYYNPARAAATHEVNAWILSQVGARLDQAIDAFSLLSCGDPERLCAAYAAPFKDGLHFGKLGHARLAEALRRDVFPNCE